MDLFDLFCGLPRQGPGSNDSTKKAFEMIPKLSNPLILDVGCGCGSQTIQLAKLSKGNVLGLDVCEAFLNELKNKAKSENLDDKVKTVLGSMFEMNFEEKFFDIIWAEGSIYIMGFEEGLKSWKKFLKPNGYMAVSDIFVLFSLSEGFI